MKHLASEAGLDWTVDSAGTNGYHTGEKPHRSSQKVCRDHGIDISGQRASRFTARDFGRYDLIYAMARDVYEDIRSVGGPHADMSKVKLFLEELEPGSGASVPDPWYGAEDGYLPVYRMIEETCRVILHKYAGQPVA